MIDKVIPYGTQHIDESDIEAVIQTLKSPYMTQGPKIKEFEEVVAKYHNSKYAVSFSNGTAALHAAYHASGIKSGEEFITTPITFAATSNAGLYVGAKPKFVDICSNTPNIKTSDIISNITSETKVVTLVSYGGFPIDIRGLKQALISLNREDIVIIHDAAHAIGAKINGDNIGDIAEMTMVSFHPVKHVATGEGGIILTNNEEYFKSLLLFRNHGITKNPLECSEFEGDWYYEMQELGYNYRMTDLQAALGISQMKKLDNSLYQRNKIASVYDQELKGLTWLKTPDYSFSKSWLATQKDLTVKPDNLNSYHLYPIKVQDVNERKDFFNYLRSCNIWVQVHYIPVHTLPYYKKNFQIDNTKLINSELFYKKEISLPMFPTLSELELEYVLDCIKKYRQH